MGGRAALALCTSVAVIGATGAFADVGEPGLQTDQIVLDYLTEKYDDDGPIPVQFWAEGNDRCEVTFTVINRTNSTSYLVDFIVDDEDPMGVEDGVNRDTWDFKINKGPYKGTDIGPRTLGWVGVRSESSGPHWGKGDDGVNVKFTATNEPVTSTNTIDLRDLPNPPNPEADTHTITYQQIGGPDHGFGGVQSDMPVFTTEVSGCAAPAGPWGSLEDLFGSGSAGSVDVLTRLFHH